MSFGYTTFQFGVDTNTLPILKNLIAHYEASDYENNFTFPNAPTSFEISEWKDISGNNPSYDLIQTSASSQPILQLNLVNGKSVVRFDGINDNIVTTNQWLNGTTARTTVAVWRGDTSETSGITYRNQTSGGGGTGYDVTSEVGVRVLGGNRLFDQSIVDADTSITFVTVFQSAASSNVSTTTARKNGVYLGQASSNPVNINTGTGSSQIGLNAGNQLANAFTGDVAEVIIYDRVLNISEIQTLESYLGAKWGVSITV